MCEAVDTTRLPIPQNEECVQSTASSATTSCDKPAAVQSRRLWSKLASISASTEGAAQSPFSISASSVHRRSGSLESEQCQYLPR